MLTKSVPLTHVQAQNYMEVGVCVCVWDIYFVS